MPDEQKTEESTVVSEPVNEPEIEPQVSESETTPEVIEPAPEVTETEAEIAPEIPENATSEASAEPAKSVPEPETAQMAGNEPLAENPVGTLEAENEGAGASAEAPEELEPTPAKAKEKPQTPNVEREEKPTKKEPSIREKLNLLRQMAHATIALRREKKYVKIMELFAKQTAITNDDVQGLLRVSDATATRYLSELEKRGKLKQVGTTGRGVSYVKQ